MILNCPDPDPRMVTANSLEKGTFSAEMHRPKYERWYFPSVVVYRLTAAGCALRVSFGMVVEGIGIVSSGDRQGRGKLTGERERVHPGFDMERYALFYDEFISGALMREK